MGSEIPDVALGDDSFLVEADEVEYPVEGVLLPFEVVGMLLGELLLRREAPILEGEGEDGFA